MPDIDSDSPLPLRILYALESNQHRVGLTVPEIKEVLGLNPRPNKRLNKKIYKSVAYLIKDNRIQHQRHPLDGRLGFYTLPHREVILAELLEVQKLPLNYVVLRLPANEVKYETDFSSVHPLIPQLDLSTILESVLSEWNTVVSPKFFPATAGLYAIYSRASDTCLYIGQALNLASRGRYHWLWKEALYNMEQPYAAYKVIECGHPDKTKRELVYEESLLIGLLRPKWNSATPPPRHDIAPDNHDFGEIRLIHWTQLVDSCYEPFHPSMLTDDGYIVLRFARANTGVGKTRKQWVRVLYDREYVQEWVNDLCDQVDAFFKLRGSN